MFTTMAKNKGNFVRVRSRYGKHRILVKKVVCEKLLVKTCKYIIPLK